MGSKKRGLGRGLDALLGSQPVTTKPAEAQEAVSGATETEADIPVSDGLLKEMPIEYLQRGKYQPRRDMDQEALEELAESIKAQGVMQPIVVRPIAKKKYEIIAGERRWRACQLAGLSEVPVIIKDVPDEAAVAMALIENIQREDLNPIEEAFALQRLQDEFELTQQQVADAVGKSRTTVTNLLRLTGLNEDVRRLMEHGDLEMGHAKAILGLQEKDRSAAARTVVSKGLSVRQTEAMVRRMLQPVKPKAEDSQVGKADIHQLEEKISETLGASVHIQHTAKGKGRLVIKYNSVDELDGILNHIK